MAETTKGYKLFTPLDLGDGLVLKNRVVMGPMTRCRSDKPTHAPSEINQIYYEQRAGAGLIVSEATGISDEGFGWFGAPAMYNETHVEAWKKVTDRVHARGGKIFLQMWHMGRQAHPSFNPRNECVSASAIALGSGRLRDNKGEHAEYVTPRALETDEIPRVVEDYRKGAVLAKKAGFDGVEIHAANGYLIDCFLQSVTNKRTDQYGGSIENRARFLLEVVEAIKTVWPSRRIGVRLSPNGGFAGMGSPDNFEQFRYTIEQLGKHDLSYLAVLDGSGFGYHEKALKGSLPTTFHGTSRHVTAFDAKLAFKGTVIANNSYTRDTAEGAIRGGAADAVGFGRAFISNPDLAERFQNDWPLNEHPPHAVYWDPFMLDKGYSDFPTYEEVLKQKASGL